MKIPSYLIKINTSESIVPGTLIRRIGNGKDQQGAFEGLDGSGRLIIRDVIDFTECSFAAERGILAPGKGDVVYRYAHSFQESPSSMQALQIVQGWVLFEKHASLQNEMLGFVQSSFSPEQILYLRHTDSLEMLFIPIQQKFKIGKFIETVNWNSVRTNTFRRIFEALDKGEHITYIAFIPETKSHQPMFYSAGTRPHQETHAILQRETFAFRPSHGGHIKKVSGSGDSPVFIVDAGSNYLGRGMNTPLSAAERIANGLYLVYTGYTFIPVEGRSAFGTQQSY